MDPVILYTLENYRVEVDSDREEKCYLLRNIGTGVVEIDDSLLPRIMDTAIQLDLNLTKSVIKMEDYVRPLPELTLVTAGEGDGEGDVD